MDRQTSLELKNRVLWFDGDSSMPSDVIADMLLAGKSIKGLHPLELDRSVKLFNLHNDIQLTLKDEIEELDTSYTIPEDYLNIDLRKHILLLLKDRIREDNITNDDDIEERIGRVLVELEMFKQYKIENLIKTVIYIVDSFKNNDIVWGTGRGSSCACYSLYLIGLHDVDSVKYELDLNEFFR